MEEFNDLFGTYDENLLYKDPKRKTTEEEEEKV
jgi:hypothetical protein